MERLNLRDRIQRDLRAALKSRDRAAVDALRSALAAIANAEAVESGSADTGDSHLQSLVMSAGPFAGAVDGLGAGEVDRRELDHAAMVAILEHEREDRFIAADQYEQFGQHDAAAILRAQIDVLKQYIE